MRASSKTWLFLVAAFAVLSCALPAQASAAADLEVSTDVGSLSLPQGVQTDIEVTVENHGPAASATRTLTIGSTPANADFDDVLITPSRGTDACTPSGGADLTISCDIGPVANGETLTINVALVPLRVVGVGNLDVGFTAADPDDIQHGNDQVPVTYGIHPNQADLVVGTPAGRAVVTEGDDATVTNRVINYGLEPASNVVITAPIPSGLTFVSGRWTIDDGSTWTACLAPGGVFTCNVGTVAYGAEVHYEVTVTGDTEGAYLLEFGFATSGGNSPIDPTVPNVTRSLVEVDPPNIDLVSAISNAGQAAVGASATLTASVGNRGSRPAGSVVAEVRLPVTALPTSATYTLGMSTQACVVAGQVVTCTIGSIAAGDDADISIQWSGVTPGDGIARISATSDGVYPDFTPGNTPFGLGASDLATTRTLSATEVALLATGVDLGVDVENSGPGVDLTWVAYNDDDYYATHLAANVVLDYHLPPGVTAALHASAAPGISCTAIGGAGGLFRCQLGSIAADDEVEVPLTLSGVVSGHVVHVASVRSSEPEWNTDNNVRDFDVTSGAPVGLISGDTDLLPVVSQDAPSHVALNSPYGFDIQARNNGGADSTAVLDITLPPGVTLASSVVEASGQPGSCTFAAPVLTCLSTGSLQPGQNLDVGIEVEAATAGRKPVEFSVSGDQSESDPSDNVKTVVFEGWTPSTVDASVNVAVSNFGQYNVGQLWTADITAEQQGMSSLPQTVRVDLPTGTVVDAVSPGTCTNPTPLVVQCPSAAPIQIDAHSTVATFGSVTATTAIPDPDIHPSNNRTSSSVQVSGASSLTADSDLAVMPTHVVDGCEV